MAEARLHDGTTIDVEILGHGPALLMPVNPVPATGSNAEELRAWGVDPSLGRTIMEELASKFTVVAFDYEGHRMASPAPDTLTPVNIASDFLSVADSAGIDQFAYYGYSWLAVCGLQLVLRTDRLAALAMGGFPPLNGPYRAMLQVTEATHRMASEPPRRTSQPTASQPASPDDFDWNSIDIALTEAQTRQFVTLYRALSDFDDRKAQERIRCPRMCFVGAEDVIEYGDRWGGVRVAPGDLDVDATRLAGWHVEVLDGLNHTRAMQPANVLPILKPWLENAVGV
ncbi:alpha/beta fold hydrolase [Rhodococcus sp. NPDC055024]